MSTASDGRDWRSALCSVEGCGRAHMHDGLCEVHLWKAEHYTSYLGGPHRSLVTDCPGCGRNCGERLPSPSRRGCSRSCPAESFKVGRDDARSRLQQVGQLWDREISRGFQFLARASLVPELRTILDVENGAGAHLANEDCPYCHPRDGVRTVGDLTARHLGEDIEVAGQDHGELFSLTLMSHGQVALGTELAFSQTQARGIPGEHGAYVVSLDETCFLLGDPTPGTTPITPISTGTTPTTTPTSTPDENGEQR